VSDLRLPRINRIMLSGRVTRDFVLRYTADDVPVAAFTVAFNRPVRKADGTWGEMAGFVNVLVSHRLAEQCAERLKKGSPLYLEGRLQTRKFEGADGRARSALEIKADVVQFLDRAPGEGGGGDEVPKDAPEAPEAPDATHRTPRNTKPQRPVEPDLPF
jgi:single-strand DNA-binding protein